MTEDPTTLLNALAGGAVSNAPATVLLAYLIKQIKDWKTAAVSEAKADATQAAKLLILEHRVATAEKDRDDCRARLTLLEAQLAAVWRKIGSRPSDRNRDDSGD